MKTSGSFSGFNIILFVILISSGLFSSACGDITAGEALGVILSDGSNNTYSSDCEANFTQRSVKWQYEIESDKMTVAGEAAGVVILMNWRSHVYFKMLGIDKSDGEVLWIRDNLIPATGSTPKTYIGENEIMIRYGRQAVKLDALTGETRQEIDIPFIAKKFVFHKDVFYAISDPCDETATYGIYQSGSNSRDQMEMLYELTDWSSHRSHLSNFAIAELNGTTPILMTGVSWYDDGETYSEIIAINVIDKRLLWKDYRVGYGTSFGSELAFQIYKDQLLVSRRRGLSFQSITDGSTIWENSFSEEGFYNSKAYYNNDRIYIQDKFGKENFCFDGFSGDLIWKYFRTMDAPPYFNGEQLIWGGQEEIKGLTAVNKEMGGVGITLEQPWEACKYAYFNFIENSLDNTTTIIANDDTSLVGLAY